jgi:site-specific DNA-methyltransferase (adenine-specific)
MIWDKINAEPAIQERVMNSMYEFVIVFAKQNAIARQFDVFNAGRGTFSNVIRLQKNHQRQGINHKAVFPLQLPQTLIRNFTMEGDTVLDPFMGSATTAIACIKEKRHYIGFELNKEYYDKACERIRNEQAQMTLF